MAQTVKCFFSVFFDNCIDNHSIFLQKSHFAEEEKDSLLLTTKVAICPLHYRYNFDLIPCSGL